MGGAFASSMRASRRMAASLCVAAILRDASPRDAPQDESEYIRSTHPTGFERSLRLTQADTNPQFWLLGEDVNQPRHTSFGSVQGTG